MKFIYLIFCCLLMTSCGFFHFVGTKDEVAKSELEILDYAKKNKFVFDEHFVLYSDVRDSFSNKTHALDLWKLERNKEQSFIQLRIYDSFGNLVNGYAQCYGELNRVNILAEKDFRTMVQFPNNFDLKFADNLKLFTASSEELMLKESQGKKYTMVIYWNIWSNYYSRIMFRKLGQYLKKYKMRDQIYIISVNTDNISLRSSY